jgi:hypothetical protein
MENINLIGIKLTQFDDYRTCSWVQGLISLSSDFFSKKKVINATLFLESNPSDTERALNLLNEASGMDFTFTRYKSGSIKLIEKLIKGD